MRELQAARDAEEKAMREQARKLEEEAAKQRLKERQQEREREREEERQRREKYGHLGYNDPAYNKQMPPDMNRTNSYPAPDQQQPQSQTGSNFYAPTPPARNSSYEATNQMPAGYRSQSTSQLPPNNVGNNNNESFEPGNVNGPPRSFSSSGIKPESPMPYGNKKSVSFNQNLTTEIHTQPYPSTSSEGSLGFQTTDPAGGPTPQNPTYIFSRSMSSGSYDSQYGAPTTPTTPGNEVFDSYRTPENQGINNQTLVVSSTPGVVGAQEVYRDPRDRINRQKADLNSKDAIPERMSFRDKMKMFATEIGENTPKERPKISRAQRDIETNLNGSGR